MTREAVQSGPRRVAFLLDNLSGGGAERVVLDLASGFATLGYDVDLLVCELRGELCNDIPAGVNLVLPAPSSRLLGLWSALSSHRESVVAILSYVIATRKVPRSFSFIRSISKYLREQRPAVLMSALPKSNINALLAVKSASTDTRVFLGAHIFMSIRHQQGLSSGRGQFHTMIPLLRYCYSRAEAVIACSQGVAEDAIAFLGLDPDQVHVVYNPVPVTGLARKLEEPVQHPWFVSGAPPVLVGMGRLVEQKNFPLLIRAFARVRQRVDARLVIIGGDESSRDQAAHRQHLLELATELDIAEDVELLGYQINPYPYLKAARLFVLSSTYEGFGIVLIEAMLAGCPVVSTDCPSGPAEILDGGRYGVLVPVDDTDGLAAAILASLAIEHESDKLHRRGREFSPERAVEAYHRLFFGDQPVGLAGAPGDLSPAKPTS